MTLAGFLASNPVLARQTLRTPQKTCARLLRQAPKRKKLPKLPKPHHVNLDKIVPPTAGIRDAVVAAILHKGHILLNLRGGDVGYRQWGIIGGKVDPGESLRQALDRELFEEVGIEKIISPKVIFVHYHYDAAKNQYYRVFVVKAELYPNEEPSIMEVDKILALDWFPLDRLPKPLFSEFDAYKTSLQ